MLYRQLLNDELVRNKGAYRAFAQKRSDVLRSYHERLERLELTDYEDLKRRCSGSESIGAIPADEISTNGGFCFRFGEEWMNHGDAREWAASVIDRRTTFAADGSQIYIEKETTLPVGAVQIGWFENPHDPDRPYVKNASFEILPPETLFTGADGLGPETRVGERRFHAEVEKTGEFLNRATGWRERGDSMPVAFFDGTLLVSFSLPQTRVQESFLQAIVNLVTLSRDAQVPVVGYVDRSFARDVVSLLDHFDAGAVDVESTIFDASLFSGDSPAGHGLHAWGDRTCFCYSNRRGLGVFIDESTGRSLVGFCYLKTTAGSVPARLDIPAWVYENGWLEELIDVVRAECVVGLGYPHPLEAADQTAVISTQDRAVLIRALQEFSSNEELSFTVSRKNASKGRRR